MPRAPKVSSSFSITSHPITLHSFDYDHSLVFPVLPASHLVFRLSTYKNKTPNQGLSNLVQPECHQPCVGVVGRLQGCLSLNPSVRPELGANVNRTHLHSDSAMCAMPPTKHRVQNELGFSLTGYLILRKKMVCKNGIVVMLLKLELVSFRRDTYTCRIRVGGSGWRYR